MRRAGKVVALALGVSLAAGVASAATLSIVPDKTTYAVGEAVIVQLVGDSQGASEVGIFGKLRFDPAILSGESAFALVPTADAGAIVWREGFRGCGSDFCVAMNSLAPTYPPLPVDQTGTQVWATATLRAEAPGTVSLSLEEAPQSGYQLRFFGLTSAAPVAIQVVGTEVPSASRIPLALLALLLAGGAASALRSEGRAEAGR